MDNIEPYIEHETKLHYTTFFTSISLWNNILMGNHEYPILCFAQVECFLFENFGVPSDNLPILPLRDDV